MNNMIKTMTLGAGFAALAATAPAAAQYYPGYGQYGYNGYNNNVTQIAAQRCQAAVQNRLSYRTNSNGLLGAILGTSTSGRVLGVTQVTQRRNTVKVRGVASTGRMAYNQYGMGYYGTLGANYQPDLTFSCDVDYRGYVRDVDINRR
ncbi:hypothetical protein LZ496_02940 [Sphingomonas sp. NSE70-1]|uniref:Uncharacterized protein n=1 Tax=Sphingomonas caseinilyticus TaxID=2908205 RepID=A0ABT0RSR1_9SPHN|nr:hypothetical protein [Sphingomonas caseinilyticus]MCL6697740.1 hypothetical protein [Sphingomonas caseinilyticus]